jgi:hypothetical protein
MHTNMGGDGKLIIEGDRAADAPVLCHAYETAGYSAWRLNAKRAYYLLVGGSCFHRALELEAP